MRVIEDYVGDKEAALSAAVLCYGHVVTFHKIKDGAIQAGVPLSRSQVEEFFLPPLKPGKKAVKASWIPANVLALGVDKIVWHVAPAVRQMFFSRGKMQDLSGAMLPQPHLVFSVDDEHLSVYAIKQGGRPTPDTPLYRAPYWNVFDDGGVCQGSVRFPATSTVESMPRWEHGFFGSEYSHSSTAQIAKGGHDKLWADLKGKKRFLDSRLLPLNLNLNAIL